MSAPAETSEDSRLHQLQDILASGAVREASRLLRSLAPAEIAHLLESLPAGEREIIWNLVDEEQDGEILLQVTEEVRAALIRHMAPEELLAATEKLDLDDLADLVQQMPSAITAEVMNALDDQRRKRLEAVLSYSEDTAGGLMNTDTVTVRPEVTLDVVLRYLRRLGEGVPEDTDKLFVVNRDDGYLGILMLSQLVTRNPEDTVAEAMSLNMQPIRAEMLTSEVARRFEAHDMLSAPVVDDDGRLLGRITVDDVIDVIREEGEHQFMGRAGLSEDEDMFAPVLASARRRALWLGINLATAFLASWVIGQFEETLTKVVALAVLMPIVASMGGIAGSQTLTLAIRGIALGQLSSKNARALMLKELAVGTLNSLVWAVVVAVIAGVWFDSAAIAILIGAAITINLVFAAITGSVLPLLLERIGIDPALAGSVLLTTVTDVVGFLSFLGLATLFLV
ncbi:MAG: magnesium transporter [Chromatiaceae bacterium]|nr:magnesium transporter [Gammaproteobacteria bacterium]MCP5318389.1 magnesium transporter [Chromatiaceae bacterium]MCP5435769.1 magnesium transporter [Chromatiaceae bacterium]MCP5441328.1 magnesium transporter [Chromatiaceae bacterium]HOP16866.1 magnesium transporter [Gammaproteobacteria bacterium]